MSPRLESLEGKTLLSAGSGMQHLAPRLAAASMVGQEESFRGTLAGSDSDVSLSGIPLCRYLPYLEGPSSAPARPVCTARCPRGRTLGQASCSA